MRRAICAMVIGLVALPVTISLGQQTVHVSALAGDDGWSGLCAEWDGATCGPKATIQAGIDAAAAGDTVLVAAGTYSGPGNRDLDFGGKPIKVRSAAGDPATCVIDCERSGRGFYFHSGETAAAVVEGFTIRQASVPDPLSDPVGAAGAGICIVGSSPTIRNCIITLCLVQGSWSLDYRRPGYGAGIFCDNGSPTIIECVIAENTANDSGREEGAFGGGICCRNFSNARIINCDIRDNTAVVERSSPSLGGGIYCDTGSTVLITGSTITGNEARNGAGISCVDSDVVIRACHVQGNRPESLYEPSGSGGGIYFNGGNAVVEDCEITQNSAYLGAGVYGTRGHVLLQNCLVHNNDGQTGAGLHAEWYANVTAQGCRFLSNGERSNIESRGAGYVALRSCLIAYSNWAVCAHAYADVTVSHCTLVNNVVGVVGHYDANAEVVGSILWDNETSIVLKATAGEPAQAEVRHSNVQGGPDGADVREGCTLTWDAGNIDADPQFVDAGGGDFHVAAGSPCIDAGPADYVLLPGDMDMDGEFRTWNASGGGPGIIDIGADEFGSFRYGDLNCDGLLNVWDIDPFILALTNPAAYALVQPNCYYLLADLNGDGLVNVFDIDVFVAALTGR